MAVLSGRRLESEGSGRRPLPLFSMRAKWLKPYLSSAGLALHCSQNNMTQHWLRTQLGPGQALCGVRRQ